MKASCLTAIGRGATSFGMTGSGIWRRKRMRMGWALTPIVMLAGCISVEAPDGPIVIELNINIRSEVIYQLAEDTVETIEENADIF